MRSTNLILILILMNSMAGVAAVALPWAPVPSVGGGDAINEAQNQEEALNPEQSGVVDEFVGGILSVADFLDGVRTVVFAGPEMLRNLGAPGVLVTGFQAVVGLLVAMDMAEILSGRIMS
jgi:hypothetical protein